MNYKSMLLIALLLPAFCYSKNNEESVSTVEERVSTVDAKTISDAQYKKILELKEISKRIKTSNEFIRTWVKEQYDYQLNNNVEREIGTTSANPGLFQVAYTQIKCVLIGKKHPIMEAELKIRTHMFYLMRHLAKALHGKGTFDCDLSKELFDWDTKYVDGIFATFEFACIDAINEYYLLEYHVGCYQECLNELIEMSKKSATLKQEG